MDFIWVVIIGIIIFLVIQNKKKKARSSVVNEKEEPFVITEEVVFKAQNRFEDKITNETEFPDAISGNEIYIYRNLMRPWFDKLAAKHRYDEQMAQKLRSDWLDYIEAVGDRSTYNYLSLEFSEDEEKSKRYREDHVNASRKMFAIQEAFATAIGEEAIAELNKVQEMDFMMFSRHGELAPEGFKWDLGRRELVPVKEKKK